MTIHDDNWFNELLQGGFETAPVELRAAVRQLIAGDHPAVAGPRQSPTRRRWLLPVTVAAATITLVIGLTLLANRNDDTITPSQTTNPISQPSTTTPNPTTTTSTPTTTTQPSTPTTSTPSILDQGSVGSVVVEPAAATPEDLLAALELTGAEQTRVISGEDVTVALTRIDAYRNKLLRSSPGFAATSTFWTEHDGNSPFPLPQGTPTVDDPRVAEMTLLATGAIWANYSNGDWFEYDPSTGIEHQLSESPFDGELFARERLRPPDPYIVFEVSRHDPFALLAHQTDAIEIEISTTSFEGGPAIEVRPLQGSFNVFLEEDGAGARYVVDFASGLIVEAESTTSRLHSFLTDITAVNSLPAGVPPPLPDGQIWQRSSMGHSGEDGLILSLQEASDAFGPGLILPVGAIKSGSVWVEQLGIAGSGSEVEPDAADASIRSVLVRWTSFEGLSQTTYYASVERPGASDALPPGYTEVGDHLCYELCVRQSNDPTTPVVVPQSGALVGVPFQDRSPDFFAHSDGVSYGISSRSLDEATDIVNSLVVVSD